MNLEKLAFELTGAAHEVRGAPELRARVLDLLHEVAPSETGVFAPLDPGAWGFTARGLTEGDRLLVSECQASLWRYAGDVKRGFETGLRRGGYIDTEVYSVAERGRLAIFREVVRKQRISGEAGLFPRWRGRPLGFIRLSRHGGGSFRAAELERLLQLLPTVALVMHAVGADDPPTAEVLTPRETEIARYVAAGLTTPEIARLLGTSPRTVRNQLSAAFQKVHVSGRAELAAWLTRRTP